MSKKSKPLNSLSLSSLSPPPLPKHVFLSGAVLVSISACMSMLVCVPELVSMSAPMSVYSFVSVSVSLFVSVSMSVSCICICALACVHVCVCI